MQSPNEEESEAHPQQTNSLEDFIGRCKEESGASRTKQE